MRSLVAEDEPTNRILLQKALSKYGECHIAINGLEAVEAVKKARQENRPYDLVCMDLRMPVMNGHEAIREIRNQEAEGRIMKTTRIIVTTALSDMDSITGALIGKCNAYLMKPIDLAKLTAELKELGLAQ